MSSDLTSEKHLAVGQVLWCVPDYRRKGSAVTVTKVGRKWASLDNHSRVDIKTLQMDHPGFGSRGKCFLSKEAYEADISLQDLWRDFRSQVDRAWNVPANVSINEIQKARRELFEAKP